MKLIDEVDVKMALEKGTSDLKIIHKRILDLYDELIEVDSVIRSVAMKSPKYGNIGGGVGGIKKDLADIMLRHEQTARARGIELREEMYRLTEEEESINRIQACFRALQDKEYLYLDRLYVQHTPYKIVESESGVSHKTFERTRAGAVNRIITLYNSDLSNQEIIRQSKRKERLKEKSRKFDYLTQEGVASINLFDEYVQIWDEDSNFVGDYDWFYFAAAIHRMWNGVSLEKMQEKQIEARMNPPEELSGSTSSEEEKIEPENVIIAEQESLSFSIWDHSLIKKQLEIAENYLNEMKKPNVETPAVMALEQEALVLGLRVLLQQAEE